MADGHVSSCVGKEQGQRRLCFLVLAPSVCFVWPNARRTCPSPEHLPYTSSRFLFMFTKVGKVVAYPPVLSVVDASQTRVPPGWTSIHLPSIFIFIFIFSATGKQDDTNITKLQGKKFVYTLPNTPTIYSEVHHLIHHNHLRHRPFPITISPPLLTLNTNHRTSYSPSPHQHAPRLSPPSS